MELRRRLSDPLESAAAGGAACPQLAQELAAYAGGDIDQATCARIDDHLRQCARCTAACAALRRTVSLCRAIPGGEVPQPVRSAVKRALLAASSTK
jgi:RNA polymerase sigma-70 factor (ECF subfamily)